MSRKTFLHPILILFLLAAAGVVQTNSAQAASLRINENNYLVYSPGPGDSSSQVAVAKDPVSGRIIFDPYFDSRSSWWDYLRIEYRQPREFETANGNPASNPSPLYPENAPSCDPVRKANMKFAPHPNYAYGAWQDLGTPYTVFSCPANIDGIKISLAPGTSKVPASFHTYLPAGSPYVQVENQAGQTDFGIFGSAETYIDTVGSSRALIGGLDPVATFNYGGRYNRGETQGGYTSITSHGSSFKSVTQTGQVEILSDSRYNDVFLDGGSTKFIADNPGGQSKIRLIDGQNRVDVRTGKSRVLRYRSSNKHFLTERVSKDDHINKSWWQYGDRIPLPNTSFFYASEFAGQSKVWLGAGVLSLAPQVKENSSRIFRSLGPARLRSVLRGKFGVSLTCVSRQSRFTFQKRWVSRKKVWTSKYSWRIKFKKHNRKISRGC